MKKLLSIFLAILMVSAVVAMIPVFTVSAADAAHLKDSETVEIINTKTQIAVNKDSLKASFRDDIKGNLFDSKVEDSKFNAGAKWEGQLNGEASMEFQTTAPATVAYYVVYTGNDSGSYGGRNPDTIKFYGSTDGVDYVELDVVDNPGMENHDNKPYSFKIDSPASYQYYKITFSKASDHYFQVNELVLYSDTDAETTFFTKNTDESSLAYGRYLIPGSIDGGVGCGFIDGNANVNENNWYGLTELLDTTDNATILENIKVYLNGVEAHFNKSYLGYTHCGRNGSDGCFYGIVGAGFTSGVETTVTFLIGDKYYMQSVITPNETAHAVESSSTAYYTTEKKLVTTVTFVEDIAFTEGQTLTMRLHDDHTDRNATVTKVDGKTVTIEVKDFSTSKSLCEFTLADGTKFSLPINVNPKTEKAIGYIQTRANADPTKFDTRVLIEAHQDYTANFDSASLEITFTLANGTTRTFNVGSTTVYEEITAGNDIYTATDDCALFGHAITDIPKGTNAVAVKVTFHNSEEGTSETIDVGSASLTVTADATVSDIKAMNKVDSSDITVNSIDDGRSIDDGEGAKKLFDGTTSKHGSHSSTFTINFNTAEATTITGIIFTVGNDSYSNDRYYTSWKLEGQNADGSWSVVAQSIGSVTKGSADYKDSEFPDPDALPDSQRQAYSVDNAGTYTAYRFTATGNGGNYNQMGEMTLYTK